MRFLDVESRPLSCVIKKSMTSTNYATNFESTIAALNFSASSSADRGKEAYDKGDFSEAVGLFSLVLLSNPGDLDALRGRAESYFRLEEYQKSLNDATQLLAIVPDDPAMLFRRGTILTMNGHFDEAIADLTRLLRQEPDDVEGLLYRFWAYMQQRQFLAAEEDLRYILIILPDETPIQTTAVHFFLQTGALQPANTVISRILNREPENVEMLKYRGIVWRHLGVPDMAVKDFSRAMDVAGPNAELLTERAIALIEMGQRSLTNKRYNRAVYDFTWVLEEMAEQLENQAPIFFHRAQAWALIAARNWFDKSGYKKSLADYTEALSQKPDFIEALFHRATLHWQLGSVAETLEDCNRLLELQSDHTEALQLRAEVYLKLKEPEKAEADFQTIDRLHEIMARQQAQNLDDNRSACDNLDCSRFCRH